MGEGLIMLSPEGEVEGAVTWGELLDGRVP
jgi:hypothetical protein